MCSCGRLFNLADTLVVPHSLPGANLNSTRSISTLHLFEALWEPSKRGEHTYKYIFSPKHGYLLWNPYASKNINLKWDFFLSCVSKNPEQVVKTTNSKWFIKIWSDLWGRVGRGPRKRLPKATVNSLGPDWLRSPKPPELEELRAEKI